MANLKNTRIEDTGFIKFPSGTLLQRPESPAVGEIRYNTNSDKIEYFNTFSSAWLDVNQQGTFAEGGIVFNTNSNGTLYRTHIFNTNGTFDVYNSGEVEFLIVAGGGGGGANSSGSSFHTAGGGGGAGELGIFRDYIESGSYSVTVGLGGSGANGIDVTDATNGGNSNFFGKTLLGGGAGSSHRVIPSHTANNGGSGGGSGRDSAAGSAIGSFKGNPGGSYNNSTNTGAGAGGGGAGEAGKPSISNGGAGGNGISNEFSGFFLYYAAGGGGGGGGNGSTDGAPGGLGGGGQGGDSPNSEDGTDGVPNTGSGGGGSGADSSDNPKGIGGNGGNGVVIVRYPIKSGETNVNDSAALSNDGLVLDLDFAKSTTTENFPTVQDSRLTGIVGNAVNSPIIVNKQSNRSACRFDGSNQSIDGSLKKDVNAPFTLECIGKFDNLTKNDYEYFGSLGDTGTNSMISISKIGTRDSSAAFHGFMYVFDGSGGVKRTDIDLRDLNWQHIVVVCTITSPYYKVFKNGIQGSVIDGLSGAINTNGTFRIGTYSSNTWYLDGNIAVQRVYNRELTNAEVANNFEAFRWRFGI